MYFNKHIQRVVIDSTDIFLLSVFITFYITKYLKEYYSEKQLMEKLREDLIRQSKLIKSSSKEIISYSPSSANQGNKTYYIRGGDMDIVKQPKLLEFIVGRTNKLILWLWLFCNTKENKNHLIFQLLRFNLSNILKIWQVSISTFDIEIFTIIGSSPVIPAVAGAVLGSTAGCLGVAATLLIQASASVFLFRSLTQQVISLRSTPYNEVLRMLDEVNTAKKLGKRSTLMKKMDYLKQISDKEPKLRLAGFNQDLDIEKTAENLGLLKEQPIKDIRGPIKSINNNLSERYKLSKRIKSIHEKFGIVGEKINQVGELYDKDIEDMSFVKELPIFKEPPIKAN